MNYNFLNARIGEIIAETDWKCKDCLTQIIEDIVTT